MKHVCPKNKAIVIRNKYIEGCNVCIGRKQSSDFAAKYTRDRMRENHRADLVQAWDGDKPNPEYAKLYPESAKERFGDEMPRI